MYRYLEHRLNESVREFLQSAYALDLPNIVIEQPPKVELGEYALPIAFELARQLRKAPRKIAEEIVAGIGAVPGFEKFEVAGAGYINVRVNRAEVAAALAADQEPGEEVAPGKVLVEHSSINPNKAAHIGHLRNAILGDTFVRLLRFAGREVDIQNYIWLASSISKERHALKSKPSLPPRGSIFTAGTSTPESHSGMSRTNRIFKRDQRCCMRLSKGTTKRPRLPT